MNYGDPIVITGLGAVCAAGRTIDVLWEAVVAGRSAVTDIRQWDATAWPVGVAAEVQGVEDRVLVEDRKLHKLLSRTDLFGLYAADKAIEHSGLASYRQRLDEAATVRFNDASGVFAGSGGGAYSGNYDFLPLVTAAGGDLRRFGTELNGTVNPMWLLRHLPNNVLCHVGIRHQFKGTNACITNHAVGGGLAVAQAAAALRAGEADRAVAIGHDAPIEPETILHYHRAGLLSPDVLRPFDQQRAGTILGEGAAAVVLETPHAARARDAVRLGTFLGSGCVSEATGVLEIRPDGEGLARAMALSLEEARLSPNAVGLIVAHGNGSRASDVSEARAIHRVFGRNPPPITAFKWAVGHSIAASSVLDLVLALTALRHGVVPGIATLRALDPAVAPLPVSTAPQKPRSDVALVLSRGFGGMNVALLVRGTASPSVG